ncbi:MAG: signal peptidase [Steroidobacteraceae bacterium]|nr:signal peptidase [Steroidobacteraceae bacterium]
MKRVVGVPGDIIESDERGLIINGVRAEYHEGDATLIDDLLEVTQGREPVVLRESGALPDHDILRMPFPSPREYFGPLRVPEDTYFMLGDNRDNSADSRYIGFVPRRNIVGLTNRVAEQAFLPRAVSPCLEGAHYNAALFGYSGGLNARRSSRFHRRPHGLGHLSLPARKKRFHHRRWLGHRRMPYRSIRETRVIGGFRRHR